MVWTTIRLYIPIQEDEIDTLQAGDRILLNGSIYAMRDQALQRLGQSIEKGERLPINLKNEILYYSGPTPALEGECLESQSTQQSLKLDPLIIRLMKELNIRAMIGKGQRSDIFRDSCRNFKSLYLEATDGIGALINHHMASKEAIAYKDLGSEAIFKMKIKDLPLVIINDIYGRDLYEIAKKEDSKPIKDILDSLSGNSPRIT